MALELGARKGSEEANFDSGVESFIGHHHFAKGQRKDETQVSFDKIAAAAAPATTWAADGMIDTPVAEP